MEDEDQFDWTQPAAGKIEKTADKDRRYLLRFYLHKSSPNTILPTQEENRMPLFNSFEHIIMWKKGNLKTGRQPHYMSHAMAHSFIHNW